MRHNQRRTTYIFFRTPRAKTSFCKSDGKAARLSIVIKCAATIIKCGTQSHKIYEGGNIQFPLGNTVAAAMVLVGLAERGAHLRITAAVDLHEVVLGGAGVAFELRSAYVYGCVAGGTDGDYVRKPLYCVLFVVLPPLVRFQSTGRCAAYHAFSARAGICLFAYGVPLGVREQRAKIGIPAAVRHKFEIEFIA